MGCAPGGCGCGHGHDGYQHGHDDDAGGHDTSHGTSCCGDSADSDDDPKVGTNASERARS